MITSKRIMKFLRKVYIFIHQDFTKFHPLGFRFQVESTRFVNVHTGESRIFIAR